MGSSPHVPDDLQPLASAPRKHRAPRGVMTELLGANTDTLDRIGESLHTDARRMQDIEVRPSGLLPSCRPAGTAPTFGISPSSGNSRPRHSWPVRPRPWTLVPPSYAPSR